MPTPTPTPAPVHGFVTALSSGFSIDHVLALLTPIAPGFVLGVLTVFGLHMLRWSLSYITNGDGAGGRARREREFQNSEFGEHGKYW